MSKFNQKGFSSIVIIIGILIVGVVLIAGVGNEKFRTVLESLNKPFTPVSVSSSSNNLQGEELIFEEKGNVYLLDTNTLQKTKLPIVGLDGVKKDIFWLSLSPDKNKLYFNVDMDLYIYDFKNQQTKILKGIGPNASPWSFSPNGQYALVDTGCCPGDRGRTLITKEGEILDEDGGTGFAWAPDSKNYALTKGDISIDAVPYGPYPDSNSIYLKEINGKNVTTEKLFNADYQNSYKVIEWDNDQTIIIEKSVFNESFPKKVTNEQLNDEDFGRYWTKIYENPKKSYYRYNITSKALDEIEKPESKNTLFTNPDVSPKNQWEIVTETEEKPYIYISQIGGSEKIKIGEGRDAIWK